MNTLFSPGCALMVYKPELAHRVHQFLNTATEPVNLHLTCCHFDPVVERDTLIINTCPGCDKRFGSLYAGVTTVSLWEIIARRDDFAFPDYKGMQMTIQDACPTRNVGRVHDAIRTLLSRMNIVIIEPEKTRERGACCGDGFYGILPLGEVKLQMQKRASEMPVQDVVVYCVSCVRSMATGARKPRYLVDLLFGEGTPSDPPDLDQWHNEIDQFKLAHGSENLSNFVSHSKTMLP